MAEHFDDCLTADEWWAEHRANACCPDPATAARTLCGCGGSAAVPSTISRALLGGEEGTGDNTDPGM